MLRRLLQPNLIRRAVAIAIGGGRYASTGDLQGNWTPSRLFSAGELGAWFDPSDLSTLFQDIAGTIPVTVVGQPVGKMLDKSPNKAHAVGVGGVPFPVLQQHSNGAYYLDCNGLPCYLTFNMPTGVNWDPPAFTMAAAVNWVTVNLGQRHSALRIGEAGWSASHIHLGFGDYPDFSVLNFQIAGYESINKLISAFPSRAIQLATKDGLTYVYRHNKEFVGTHDPGPSLGLALPTCKIGNVNGDSPHRQHIYGAIYVNKLFLGDTISQLENWLEQRIGTLG